MFDIVEADETHILRDRKPRSRSACIAPTTVILLTVKIAVGSGRAPNLLRRAISADPIDRGSKDKFFAKGDAGGCEAS